MLNRIINYFKGLSPLAKVVFVFLIYQLMVGLYFAFYCIYVCIRDNISLNVNAVFSNVAFPVIGIFCILLLVAWPIYKVQNRLLESPKTRNVMLYLYFWSVTYLYALFLSPSAWSATIVFVLYIFMTAICWAVQARVLRELGKTKKMVMFWVYNISSFCWIWIMLGGFDIVFPHKNWGPLLYIIGMVILVT